ncbi:MAG: hypothetical protein ACOYXC_17590 [Candidatus Rifleibacteriota bacterium]
MSESEMVTVKEFLYQAIELNRNFLELKIAELARQLLPQEALLRRMKEQRTASSEVHPAIINRVESLLRLKSELRRMQRLQMAIEQA